MTPALLQVMALLGVLEQNMQDAMLAEDLRQFTVAPAELVTPPVQIAPSYTCHLTNATSPRATVIYLRPCAEFGAFRVLGLALETANEEWQTVSACSADSCSCALAAPLRFVSGRAFAIELASSTSRVCTILDCYARAFLRAHRSTARALSSSSCQSLSSSSPRAANSLRSRTARRTHSMTAPLRWSLARNGGSQSACAPCPAAPTSGPFDCCSLRSQWCCLARASGICASQRSPGCYVLAANGRHCSTSDCVERTRRRHCIRAAIATQRFSDSARGEACATTRT